MTDKDFVPYIPPEKQIAEMTWKACILGFFLSIIMAAANTYLGLYVGMTVSAAIPAAVMALALFKVLAKTGITEDATILEVNVSKTMASAGESLAAGILFTIPALILIGSWDEIEILPTMGIALIGGLLGVTFTIPLRRILIHEIDLPFPEGVACTEVLIAGEEGGSGASLVFSAMGISMLWQISRATKGLHLWPSAYQKVVGEGDVRLFGGGEMSVALVGVGYIIGLRIAKLMLIGGIIGWVIILPIIGFLGEAGIYGDGWQADGVGGFYLLWLNYLMYVGVGAMVVASGYTLFTMREAITTGMKNANPFSGMDEVEESRIRTEQDISQKKAMGAAIFFLIPIFCIYYYFSENLIISGSASVIMLVAAFLFAAIAGYIAGLIGSSSNPISGITIATLLFVSIFLLIMEFAGIEGADNKTTAIGVAAVVCAAAAIAGDVMQDLKTGELVGNTPKMLQAAEYLGVVAAAITIPFVLLMMFNAYEPGVDLAMPQAYVMKAIVEGVFDGEMKLELVILGMLIAAGIIIYSKVMNVDIPIMAVAIGIYLPIIMAIPILIGGLIRTFSEGFIDNRIREDYVNLDDTEKEEAISLEKKEAESRGVLFSSGLIAGEALAGIGVAIVVWQEIDISIHEFPVEWTGLILFLYLGILLAYITLRDFIDGMSAGEIFDNFKGTIMKSIDDFRHGSEDGYEMEGDEYEMEEEEY